MPTTIRSLFVGPHGLRALWRLLLFILAFQIAAGVLQLLILRVLGYHPAPGWQPGDFLLAEGISLAAVAVATLVMARVDGRSALDYGFPRARAFRGDFWLGVLWGMVAVGLLLSAIVLAGGATVAGLHLHGAALARSALLWGLTMVVLGLFEEGLFRGYPLVALAEGIGFWPAALLLSAAFGALHYFTKPMETWTDALDVALLGLFLCLTLRRTGALWFAAGFHAAFDYAALVVIGSPNTGNEGRPIDTRLLDVRFHGAAWLTGGPDGMEASVLALAVIVLLFVAFGRAFRARRAMPPEPAAPAAIAA